MVTPDLTTFLVKAVQHIGSDGPARQVLFDDLTPREFEILRHLAEGESNKVIANHLRISDGTVKLHVKAILRKLGLSSRVEAAVLAVQRGLSARS